MSYRVQTKYTDTTYSDSNGTNWSYQTAIFQKYQNGGNTGGFHSSPKPKPLPVNTYVMESFKITPATQTYYYHDLNDPNNPTFFTSTIAGASPSVVIPRTEVIAECQAKLNAKMLSQIKDMKVNIAQAAAEANQTASMFASTARRITTAFTQLRRGNYLGACKALNCSVKNRSFKRYSTHYPRNPFDAAANAWLELQYGWKPLLSDVHGVAEKLAHERGGRPLYQRVTATCPAKADFNDVVEDRGENYLNVSGQFGTMAAYGKSQITFMVENPALQLASSVGLTDPALLAWELLPYSFVVDWFLPIGNWLENANAPSGVSFVSGWQSIKFTAKGSERVFSASWAWNFQTETQRNGGQREENCLYRNPLYGFPTNPLPSFKSPVSFTHCANALALLKTAFRR